MAARCAQGDSQPSSPPAVPPSASGVRIYLGVRASLTFPSPRLWGSWGCAGSRVWGCSSRVWGRFSRIWGRFSRVWCRAGSGGAEVPDAVTLYPQVRGTKEPLGGSMTPPLCQRPHLNRLGCFSAVLWLVLLLHPSISSLSSSGFVPKIQQNFLGAKRC